MKTEQDSTKHAKNSEKVDSSLDVNESLDAQNRLIAKKLHELGWVYGFYGALDGLSLSYSMVKYCFDLMCTNSSELSSDVMHDWMMSPAGIAATTLESVVIIGFSLIANVYDEKDNDKFKAFIATVWPYCRDAMKGLKNAYKGVRSLMQVIGVFSGEDLRSMIVPLGLLLGVLSTVNRIWMRDMTNDRKKMMRSNAKILLNIQDMDCTNDDAWAALRTRRIRSQSTWVQTQSLLGAAYGGVVDGLYLFMGALAETSLSPPVFLAMSIFCIVFSALCVATRIYEEYDFQRKLAGTQAKVGLAFCGKELELLFVRLNNLSDPRRPSYYSGIDQEIPYKALETKMQEFEAKRALLHSHVSLSYTSAAFSGIRDGLAAYGALASLMFAVATVYTIMIATFPPALLVGSVFAGAVCVLGFMVHALVKNYTHLREEESRFAAPLKNLSEILSQIKEHKKIVAELKPTKFKEAVTGGMVVDPSPQFFFQEWFEVVRSFFSGVAKGQKSVDYTLNSWQEADEHGHYHDTGVMLGLTAAASLVYAVGLALRAHARGFGRPRIDEVQPNKKSETPPIRPETPSSEFDSELEFSDLRVTPTSELGESCEISPRPDSPLPIVSSPLNPSSSQTSWFSFFHRPTPTTKTISRSARVGNLPFQDDSTDQQRLAPGLI